MVFLRRAGFKELIQQRKFVAQFVKSCFDSSIGQFLDAQLFMRQMVISPD